MFELRRDYRPDIDGLRAVAVGLVVAYHTFPTRLAGGFIGVDVFFIISGYLITRILLVNRAWGLAQFYANRIRRILPALSLVLAATLAVGAIVLLPDELARLKRDAFAASLFLANISFWKEAGYFDVSADLKPLLHLWSLGVEEQFYLLWPFVIWLLAKRSWRTVTLGICLIGIISFALNLALVNAYPSGVFYLLPTRMWELAVGGVIASTGGNTRLPRHTATLVGISGLIAIVLAAYLFSADTPFPGYFALLPTLGAAAILAAGHGNLILQKILGNAPAVYFGRISYPIYLWHWPLLSFANIIFYNRVHWPARLALVMVSFVLAALTYQFLERPIRNGRAGGALSAALLGAMGCVALVSSTLPATLTSGTEATSLQWTYWENEMCDSNYPWQHKRGWWFCEANSTNSPNLIILGDSHANQLYPGIASVFPQWSVLSIGTCDPVDDIRPRDVHVGEIPCAGNGQLEQSTFLHRLILQQPSIRYAILSAEWPVFSPSGSEVDSLTGDQLSPSYDLVSPDRRFPNPSQRDAYFVGLERRISFLEKHNIGSIIVLATPVLPYDVRQCLSRPFRHPSETCTFNLENWMRSQKSFRALVVDLHHAHPKLLVFDPIGAFCHGETCRVVAGKKTYLRDDNHLSVDGSILVASAFKAFLKQSTLVGRSME